LSFPNNEPLSSKALTNVEDLEYGEESKPNTMNHFDAMLMEEDIDDKLCMGIECRAYHALQKEFSNLIGEDFVPYQWDRHLWKQGSWGEINYNIYNNNSLNINQFPQELFEDHLVHEYGNMLGKNDSQLNFYDHCNIIMPNHTNSEDHIGNRLDEYTSARVVMCLPHGGGEKVQHNVNFTFECGDNNHIPNLFLK